MTSQLMAPQSASRTQPSAKKNAKTRRQEADPSIQEIISSGRRKPIRQPALGAWLLGGLTAVLYWSAFMPLDFGPLAWVALVPLLMLVRIPERTRSMYLSVTCFGVAAMTACLQWMRLGDLTMYPAWFALATYCGLYFPVFVAISRVAVHRVRIPLTIAVPTIWVGLEIIRAHFLTGFAWYFLGHTQYRWLELIQISDLFGAYGVSFLVAMGAACLAGLMPTSVFRRLRLIPESAELVGPNASAFGRRQIVSVVAFLAAFAAALGYGYFRRSQAEFQAGPRIALIQGNFITAVKNDPKEAIAILSKHRSMTGVAVRHQPDVIIWPETMYLEPWIALDPEISDADIRRVSGGEPKLVRERAKLVHSHLTSFSEETQAAMVIGMESLEIRPEMDRMRHYNSTLFVTPGMSRTIRYDKIHRVPFGEYIPMKERFPWLIRFTPFAGQEGGFGVDAGQQPAVFEYKGYRGTPIICFEDTVPHVVRDALNGTAAVDKNGRPADYLINVTNDGWFHGSAELDQHLITAAFRSVEYRTPMVRAVNTGISAVIDGDGAVVEPDVFIDVDNEGRESLRNPATGRWNKSLNAVLVHHVPLDNRRSLYLLWGDWFAGVCAAFCGFVVVAGWYLRRRDRKNAGRALYEEAVKAA